MIFTSDNAGPAAPQILAAITQANEGYRSSYGADTEMDAARALVREAFDAPDAEVFLVATGTAANALSLATLCPPWGAIYTHRNAHIEEDECGAPEFFTGGAKLVLVDGKDGKMPLKNLQAALSRGTQSDVHQVQRGALSITNATETGGVYSSAQVRDLASAAEAFGLPCHMDGARFANAIAATSDHPANMTWRAGVDVLSLGGTKNGCIGVEAVVLFDPDKAWEFQLRRKRAGHLFSKHRYLSAQIRAYMEDGLWLRLAADANQRAQTLGAGVKAAGFTLAHPVEANTVFAVWDRATHKRLQAAGAQYYLWPHTVAEDGPDDERVTCRLVCNWATAEEDVANFLNLLKAG